MGRNQEESTYDEVNTNSLAQSFIYAVVDCSEYHSNADTCLKFNLVLLIKYHTCNSDSLMLYIRFVALNDPISNI